MARVDLRLPTNVEGEFFVDGSCIDCDACRQLAPTVFRESRGQSSVHHQPENDDELRRAEIALVTCPTGSIGTTTRRNVKRAVDALPERIDGPVYRCGYASEKSFGAISYFVQREDGNLLIDSPRFALPLARNIEKLGGVRRMLLTHRDDVADHAQFAQHFGCERVIHADDVTRATRDVESKPGGAATIDLAAGVRMIPTPGHTRGHAVFLVDDRYLFTGDHLAWSERRGHLYAFRDACWYSWTEQIASMERLLDFRFEWVLPGHGRPIHLPAQQMRESLERCIDWMKS